MRRLLALAIAAAAVGAPGTAHAAAPCRDRVYNEWYATGKISTKHPAACYRDALRHIPADAAVYSDLDSSIKQALQAALARQRASGPARVPSSVGTGFTTPAGPHQTKAAQRTETRSIGTDPAPTARASRPVVATSSGGGLPVPIIVLGGLAAAVAAAGAVGVGVRHRRR